jgi:hypothetical protein
MTGVLWKLVQWLLDSDLTYDEVIDALPRAEQVVKLRARFRNAIAADHFDWYDPEQTGALIESQQAELAAIRQQRDNAVWLAEKQQERIAKLRAELRAVRTAHSNQCSKIPELLAENERLREALQPFALYRGRPYQERGPDHSVVVTVNTLDGLTHRITWGDLRRARAALEDAT